MLKQKKAKQTRNNIMEGVIKKLPSFEEYLASKTEKKSTGNDLYNQLVEALCESDYFTEAEKIFLEFSNHSGLSRSLILNEAVDIDENKLMQWIQDKGKKAAELVKQGAEKAKDQATQLMAKIGQSFNTFIKFILEKVQSFLKKAWEWFKQQASSSTNAIKSDFQTKIKKAKLDPKLFKTEVGQFKDMARTGITYFTGGIINDMSNGMQKAGNEEADGGSTGATSSAAAESLTEMLLESFIQVIKEEASIVKEIVECMINEAEDKIPGLSKLAHKLAKFPPFSWLHSIENTVKEKTNNVFHKISVFLHERTGAGGPYEFVLMGTVLGLAVGLKIESSVHHLIQHVAEAGLAATVVAAVPGIGLILTIMKWVATGLAIIGLAEAVVMAFDDKEKKSGEEPAQDGEETQTVTA